MDSAMDFQSLARKELQALCKKNKIPANMTNVAMADALKALTNVEGIEDMNTSSNECENPIFALKTPGTRTRKTAAVLVETEPENSPQVTRTRRGTRAKKQDKEEDKNDVKSAVLTEKESNSCVPLIDLVDTEPKSSKPVTRARRGTRQKKPEEEKDKNGGQSAAMSENEPNSSLQVIDLVETEPESSQKVAPARRGTRQKSAAVTENEPVTRPRRGRRQKEDKDEEQENNDAKDSIQTLMVDTPAVSTGRRRATGTTIRKKMEVEFEEEKYEKEKENLVTGRRCTRRTAQLISDKKTSGIVSKRGRRRSEAIKISPLSEGESDDLPKKLPSETIKISPLSEGETEDLAKKLPSDMHNENTKGLVEVHVNEHSAPTEETEVPVVVNTTADEHSAPIEETEVSVVVSTTADDHSAPIEETEVSDFIKATADDQVSEESEKEAETVMKDESDKGDTIVDDENLPSVEESEESVVENSNVDQAMVSEDVSIAADLDVIFNESVKKANSSLEDESDEENEESVVENSLDDQKIVCEDISSTVAPEDPTPYETCIENPVVGEAFDAIPSPVVGEASDAIPSPKKTTDTEGNVSISESLDMPLSVVLPAEATSSATDMAPDYTTQEKTYDCHDEKIIADHENLAIDAVANAVVKFSSPEKEFFTDGLDMSFSVVAYAGISSISNVVDPEHTTPEETGNSKGVGLIAADEENMAIGVDTGAVDKSSSPEGKLGDTESDAEGSPSLNRMMELNDNNGGADATSEGENAKDFETEFITEDDFCVDSSGKILLNLVSEDVAVVPGHSSPDKICRGESIFEDSKSVQEVPISGETSYSVVRLSVDVVPEDFVRYTSVGGLETESATEDEFSGETSGSVDVVPEHFEDDVSVEGLETESATEDESSGETSDFVLCASVYVAPEDFEGDVSVEGVVCSSVDVVPEDFEGDVSVEGVDTEYATEDEFSGEPSAAAVSLEKIITSESTDVSVDVVHREDENTKDLETEFATEVEFCGDSSSEIPAKLEAGDLNIEKVLRSPELVNSVTGQLMVSEKFEAVREDLTESFDYKVTPLKSGQKKGMTPIRSALKVFDDKGSNGSNMSLKSCSKLSLVVAGEKENININIVQKKTQEALQNSSLRQLKKMYSKEGNDSNMSMKACSKLSLVVAEEKENIIINPVQKKTDETLEKASLRQLKKMFKEKLVLADNHNKNPSMKENLLADKKRPALQALPDNCMVGGGEN